MRNPRKRRNLSLLCATAAAATAGMAVAETRGQHYNGTWLAIGIVSIHVVLFAVVGIIAYGVTISRQKRLLRGERLLARWHMSPDELQRFIEDENERAARNSIRPRQESLASGFEVIVTEESLMVDEDFYFLTEMQSLQRIPGKPACLEFTMHTAGKSGTIKWNIRFPVPADAETQAGKIRDFFYQTGLLGRVQRMTRLRRVVTWGAVLATVGALALLAALFYEGDGSRKLLSFTAFILALLTLPIGLLFVGYSVWMMKSASALRGEHQSTTARRAINVCGRVLSRRTCRTQ